MPQPLGLVSRSGTITLGGTAQTQIAQNTGRVYLLIQNIDTAEDLWFSFVGDAGITSTGSVKLVPGQMILWETDGLIPTNALSVVAATNGHKFTIYEG